MRLSKKTFLIMAAAGVLLAGLLVMNPPRLSHESAPQGVPEFDSRMPVVIDEGPYENGFRRGYLAFCNQFGHEIPKEQYIPPARSSSYTSEHAKDPDSLQGYVDGYHRAAEMQHCPSGERL